MSEVNQVEKVDADQSESRGFNLTDRMFYIDCIPEFARDRTRRAQQVADILNECRSFGTERTKEIIRSAFQIELDVSENAADAGSKMGRLVSIINLRLEKGLGLGPQGLPVKNTLYLVMEGVALTQKLSLDLKPNYKKEPVTSNQDPVVAHDPFAA